MDEPEADVFDDAFAEAFSVALNQRIKESPEETVEWLRAAFEEEMAASGHVPDVLILFSGDTIAKRHDNGITTERALWMISVANALVMRGILDEDD